MPPLSTRPLLAAEIIGPDRLSTSYQRLMLISSASISSAVVMIFDEAE